MTANSFATPDALTARFAEYWRSVHGVFGYANELGCEAFNKKMIEEVWFETYIKDSPNIELVKDQPLPRGLHAVTPKRVIKVDHILRSLFVILLAPICDRILRQFVLAHEVGHVLLHGRVMRPGWLFRRCATDWSADTNSLRRALEVEANVYALMSLIPASIIERLSEVASPTAEALQQLMTELYGSHVDIWLVRERLLIHSILNWAPLSASGEALKEREEELKRRFQRFVADRPSSWSVGGARSVEMQQRSGRPGAMDVLKASDIDEIRTDLLRDHVIPDHGASQDGEYLWAVGFGGMGICNPRLKS